MSDDAEKRVRLPRWREDFPIRWEDDDYVTRRELAKFLTLGSGLLVGANAAVAIAGRTRTARAFTPKRIATTSALGPGESLLFRYPTDEDPCIVTIQLWLLSASLEAMLAGQPGPALPATIASAALFCVSGGLLRYGAVLGRRIDR